MITKSSLVQYTLISPYKSSPRRRKITIITPHHTAGVVSVETMGKIFRSRRASATYGIGYDGRIGQYVDEADRAWTSSSPENDHRAITIECSNCAVGGNWPVSDLVLGRLIDLCVDICDRYNIKPLNFTGDATGNLTQHNYFTATGCPGPYLSSKFEYIATTVNKRLLEPSTQIEIPNAETFLVKVTANALNIRKGPSINYEIAGCIRNKGVYTITATRNGWGRLKSGIGWIYLKHTEQIRA